MRKSKFFFSIVSVEQVKLFNIETYIKTLHLFKRKWKLTNYEMKEIHKNFYV